jgi:hypothetical protein
VLALADSQLRQPLRIEHPGVERRIGLHFEVAARREQVACGLEVLSDRLARDHQCMISLEPSKMRFTCRSRITCSTGTGF